MSDRGVVIVTGEPPGPGFAIVEALLADGWKRILADRAQDPLDAARARLDAQRAMPSNASSWMSPTMPASSRV